MEEQQRRQQPQPDRTCDRLWVRLGGRIKLRREQLGFTGWKAADALGIPLQSYLEYEDGERLIPADQLAALAQLLDVPIFYFFEDLQRADGDSGSANASKSESVSYTVATETDRIAALVGGFQKLDFARQQCLLVVVDALVNDNSD